MQEQGFWLSPQQKFVWKFDQEVLCSPSRVVCAIDIQGQVQPDHLRTSLQQIVQRHEILRTGFRRQTGMKMPFQVVKDSAEFGWKQEDWSADSEESQQKRLHILSGKESRSAAEPALGAILIKLGEQRFKLMLSIASMCADSRSLQVVAHELGAFYSRKLNTLGD